MDDLIKLCRMFSLDELGPASGGNISVKEDDKLYIKSSGISLSDVTCSHGISVVNNKKVIDSLLYNSEPDIMTLVENGINRPSIEVYFHSFLKKYVVHLHPTCMNTFLCSNHVQLIEYQKPGFVLSKKIHQTYNNETIIYLKNHGVIFHADTIADIILLIKNEHNKFKQYWSVDLYSFWDIQERYPNEFIYKVSYIETKAWIQILKNPIIPYTPDIILFLYDSIIVEKNEIYIKAQNKKKCLSILEILRSYCYTYDNNLTTLTIHQVSEILNWDSEKYRKLIP